MLPFPIQKKDKILVITRLQFIYNIWDMTTSQTPGTCIQILFCISSSILTSNKWKIKIKNKWELGVAHPQGCSSSARAKKRPAWAGPGRPHRAGPDRPKTDIWQGLAHPGPGQPRPAPAGPNGKYFLLFRPAWASQPQAIFLLLLWTWPVLS